MALGDILKYTVVENGVTLEVTAIDIGGGKTSLSIKCLSGSADVNAFYWHDGINDGTIFSFTEKKDNSLNMNGTGEDWDGGYKLSSTGLGSEGTNKSTYLTAGEVLTSFEIATNWATIDTIGIRATSVGTTGTSIKGVSDVATEIKFPTISAGNVQVTEGTDGSASVTVTLSNAYPYPITLNYATGDVSAANGSDYTGTAAGSIVIPANATSATITIPITNDGVVEANETFFVNLVSAVPDVPGTDPTVPLSTSATVTIVDNDQLQISLSGDSSVTEGGSASYTITLSHALGTNVSVDIGLTLPGGLGGAEAADITGAFLTILGAAAAAETGVSLVGNTLTFTSAFDGSFSFSLPIFDDALFEGDEDYTVSLSNIVSNASLAPTFGISSVETTITDNDPLEISLTGDTTVTEGGSAGYTVSLSKALDAGVTASVDISLTLPGGLGGAEAADITGAFLTILGAAAAAETGVSLVGNTLTFTSAFDGSFSFSLPIFDDALFEGDEDYTVSLSAPTSNATGASPTLGTSSVGTTITDNDPLEISLTGDTTVTEGGSAGYTVSLSKTLDADVTASVDIGLTLLGTAGFASAADISGTLAAALAAAPAEAGVSVSGTTVTFGAGFDGSFSFSLPTFDDALIEGDEKYTVSLSSPATNATGASPTLGISSVETTIQDNDFAPVNQAPTNLQLDVASTFAALVHGVSGSGGPNNPANNIVSAGASRLLIGTLIATDPDVGDTHTFMIVSDPTTTFDDRFEVIGSDLYFKAGNSISTGEVGDLTIKVTDSFLPTGNTYYETFRFISGNSSANNISGNNVGGSGTQAMPRTGDDIIFGFGGGDSISGNGGDDALFGGQGNDVTISGGDGADQLYGGEGNDVLTGGAGNDELYGGDGNDTLTGGSGADILSGGAGNDRFVFVAVSDSTPSDFDTIIDWNSGDRIDLQAIDAIPGGLDDAFSFAGLNAGTVANSITYQKVGGQTIIRVDNTGDTTADMVIVITNGEFNLAAGDFVL